MAATSDAFAEMPLIVKVPEPFGSGMPVPAVSPVFTSGDPVTPAAPG